MMHRDQVCLGNGGLGAGKWPGGGNSDGCKQASKESSVNILGG